MNTVVGTGASGITNHTSPGHTQCSPGVRSGCSGAHLNVVVLRDSDGCRTDITNNEVNGKILSGGAGHRSCQFCEVVFIDFCHDRVGDSVKILGGKSIGRHVECGHHIAKNVGRVALS